MYFKRSWCHITTKHSNNIRLHQTARLQVKKGRPTQVIRTDNGYACFGFTYPKSEGVVTLFDRKGNELYCKKADGIWGNGYYILTGSSVSIYAYDNTLLAHWKKVSECDSAERDLFIINTTTLRFLTTNAVVDLAKICGYISQVVCMENRIVVVGHCGICLIDYTGAVVAIWPKFNNENIIERMGTIERVAIMESGNLALIKINTNTFATTFYEIDAKMGKRRTICDVPFRARQGLHGVLLDGAVPFGTGVVCRAYNHDATGLFFCDYANGTWNTIESGPAYLEEDRRLVTGGHLVISKRIKMDILLTLHKADFQVVDKLRLPIKYPEPTMPPMLLDILGDGSFAIGCGKMNREVAVYSLAKELI